MSSSLTADGNAGGTDQRSVKAPGPLVVTLGSTGDLGQVLVALWSQAEPPG